MPKKNFEDSAAGNEKPEPWTLEKFKRQVPELSEEQQKFVAQFYQSTTDNDPNSSAGVDAFFQQMLSGQVVVRPFGWDQALLRDLMRNAGVDQQLQAKILREREILQMKETLSRHAKRERDPEKFLNYNLSESGMSIHERRLNNTDSVPKLDIPEEMNFGPRGVA